MDFFLSKFINRSSPSNGTELTNEESYCNQIEDETIKNSNNHSSEGRDQGLQVNQNLPDINFITNNASTCEEQINYNSNGSKIVLDESSKLNLNGINAEHKAMEILLSGSPKEESGVYPLSAASLFSEEIIPSTSNDSQVNKTVITQTNILPNSNIKIHQKSTDKTDNIKKNSEIEIEMTENRTKISKKSIQSNPKEFSAMQETLIQGPNIDNIAKIDPDFTNNTVENQLYNFNQKKMGIQDPPDIENFNEILELLAQEDLLDEFSIATAIQYLKNSNQESELCEINSDLVIKDETELNQSSIVNNNDNPFIQENCSNIINLTNYVAESKTADKIFATKIDENKDQSVSNKTDSLNDEILNITNNKVEVPLEILHEKCDTTVAKKEQYEILGTKFSKYDINSFTDINSNKSLLLNENLNPNTISTVNTELLKEQQEQKSSASTNILNSKKIAPLDDIKIKENVKQPASVAATASDTVNVKPVENSAIANKQTQFQSNKNISKVKESEENIDPIETRRFGDVSSLFSTPDSVSPNGTFSEATLPDIINTLPTITIDTQGNDILNISSLTSHLDALHVHNSVIFQSCDFEYLSKRGSNTVRDTRKDSILLKFDPLLGKPVPAPTNLFNRSTIHEEEDTISPETSIGNRIRNREKEFQIESNNILINVPTTNVESQSKKQKSPIKLSINKKDITRSSNTFDSPLLEEFENLERRLELEEREAVVNKMSVDVISNNLKIENDVQPNENINSEINSIEKQDLKMEDLEKKIKNEVLKTEDVEKKLKDAEQREEALLKRITDKDKTIAKMGGVIEAYEKAIAELIAEKEQITQNYEKQMEEIKAERDLNKQHLESLESTFTDLHVKYERSKQLLAKLKASEEELQAEKKRNLENLGLQEQRYEKMKNHAMQQLEIANNKLEHLTKNHQLEITKLKALLKKEEIAKSSVNEQLIQKSKENEELVKICEELINGGSAS
ncbi:transforming acidic coiled-coil-containing protein 3 isoform X8 [Condylostylus longicornis]|uniref:transforming acidic coiled-coil-containing protein 3 isoform X8 n=1 Tax=Condylostylus longicornis TaxID=2530218 RepID=UPI00244DC70C|nr:transforming acidic coiled-coil-containing protein 3 isoform X8 [Condylostylus longicornis]